MAKEKPSSTVAIVPPPPASASQPPALAYPTSRLQTVREVVEIYFSQAKYSDQALACRKRFVGKFVRDFGSRPVESCCPGDLMLWISQHKDWKSSWTIRSVARFVNRPFNWAAKLRLIQANPFHGVSYEEGEPRRVMTDAEFWLIFRGPKGRTRKLQKNLFRRVLLFLRWTGCRPGEMARATWADVDWDHSVVVLQEHKSRKKTRKPRVIPLNDRCVKMLRWMQRRASGAGLIFLNEYGTAWSNSSFGRRLDNLKFRYGLAKDCVLYGLRHAFGTNGVLRGANLSLLSKAMGHSSTAITEKNYVHIDREFEAIRAAASIAGR